MSADKIQLYAAIIQAAASLLFMGTVISNWWYNRKRRETERRANLIAALRKLWLYEVGSKEGLTNEEQSGFDSPRQLEYFNAQLRARGERWTFPHKR